MYEYAHLRKHMYMYNYWTHVFHWEYPSAIQLPGKQDKIKLLKYNVLYSVHVYNMCTCDKYISIYPQVKATLWWLTLLVEPSEAESLESSKIIIINNRHHSSNNFTYNRVCVSVHVLYMYTVKLASNNEKVNKVNQCLEVYTLCETRGWSPGSFKKPFHIIFPLWSLAAFLLVP